jgi:hypothetical protein
MGVDMAFSRIRSVLVAAACGALLVPFAATSAGASTGGKHAPVVVVSGLNNPRELALVHNVLLIAEAGKGGTVKTVSGPEGDLGLGYTGSVSAVWGARHAHNETPFRIVTGLLSGAAPTDSDQGPKGSGATGPDGIAVQDGQLAIIETTFGPGVAPPAAQRNDGRLLIASRHHPLQRLANITGYEVKHDPDHMGVDSDPYAVIAYGGGWLVADAAGNDLLWVSPSGHISVFHVFPNVTTGACASQFDPTPQFPGCNFVPTSLATDRWDNVYVGGLSSLTPGEAQVVKLGPNGHVRHVWNGFTSVTGVAVAHDGTLYVSQLFAPEQHPANAMIQGVVTRIHEGNRTDMDVPFPAGLVLDGKRLYVSAYSIMPDTGAGIPGLDTSGQVWRIRF